HILTVADGKDLPETIPDTEGANPQWLDDAGGFFYTQLTGAVGTPERYLVAGVEYDRIQIPTILTAPGSRYALLQLADIRREGRWFIAPLTDAVAGKAKWVSVAGFDDRSEE